MEYRNKRTGAVINVQSEIKGEDWEPVSSTKRTDSKSEEKAPKKGK